MVRVGRRTQDECMLSVMARWRSRKFWQSIDDSEVYGICSCRLKYLSTRRIADSTTSISLSYRHIPITPSMHVIHQVVQTVDRYPLLEFLPLFHISNRVG
jgi:hypothetical protein